jgi:hypothetical protein
MVIMHSMTTYAALIALILDNNPAFQSRIELNEAMTEDADVVTSLPQRALDGVSHMTGGNHAHGSRHYTR